MSEDRDYAAEMNDRITEAVGNWGTSAGVVAAKLHAQLLENDPEFLDGWLHAMAVPLLRRVIGLRSSHLRTVGRRRAGASAFAAAADDFAEALERGSDEVAEIGVRFAGMFACDHEVDGEHNRKLVPDMTGSDHLFVAEHEYERNAKHQKMLAAFHRAVAKKVGKHRTSEVLTEEQYEAMYRSIVKGAA